MSAEAISGLRIALICFGHPLKESNGEIRYIKDTLISLGYDAMKVEFKGKLRDFIDLLEFNRPHIALNLCRAHPSFRRAELAIPGVLDLLNIPYTGPDPAALGLALDTNRAIERLAANSIPLCREPVHTGFQVTIALLGNGSPRFLSQQNGNSTEITEIARRTYSILRLRDYALLNFSDGGEGFPRLTGFVPIPDLSPHSPFALCAEASGLSYPALLDEIITHALDRIKR